MNLNTDDKSSLKGVYMFYSVIIILCIIAMFVFDLNTYFKAALCTFIFLCMFVMRCLKTSAVIDPDSTLQKTECEHTGATEAPVQRNDSTINKGGAIDTYLTLLIEADEELSKDPNIDKFSPNYNNLLNHRIGMKLDAMLKSNNHSNKD